MSNATEPVKPQENTVEQVNILGSLWLYHICLDQYTRSTGDSLE